MALENGITFIEINSKEYAKVETAFKTISEAILKKVESGKLPLNQGIGIKAGDQPNSRTLANQNKQKQKEGCC